MSSTPGNSEEDWNIFQVLIDSVDSDRMTSEESNVHEMATTLRSELAALQYKRDRLLSELQETKGLLRTRDQRALELQVETEQLKEQAARQNAVIASLRSRIQELEEKERNLVSAQTRNEMALQTLQRESRYQEERAKELDRKASRLELECHNEEQSKECARKSMNDFVRRLGSTLGSEVADASGVETLISRTHELVQENSRLRSKSCAMTDNLSSVEMELRSCRELLDRALSEKEHLQSRCSSHLMEIDKLKQEKEHLEMQARVMERELADLREKLAYCNRTLGSATSNIAANEATICNLKDDLKQKDDQTQRLQNDLRHLLESLAISLSSPARFVESRESCIKERIRDLLHEVQEKCMQVETYKEKIAILNQQIHRQNETQEQINARIKNLEEDKCHLESKLHKTEAELSACELTKENLKRDKSIFVSFLDRLAKSLNMEEISKEVGLDLQSESLLCRAEQLSRLESDKLIDKSAVVYQLQRRVRTLRDQLQRRDLHLDLLRKKLNICEQNHRVKSILEAEKEEANMRLKKVLKQVDRLNVQLSEARSLSRDLKCQLTEAEEYKTTAIDRGHKIEELEKRLMESEMLRTRYCNKVSLLKDQMRSSTDTAHQERTMQDHSIQVLREDLSQAKANYSDALRRENLLLDFRRSIVKILGLDMTCPDYEIISKLSTLVKAHQDFTSVSKRYDEPLRSPCHHLHHRTPTPRYTTDDSGFMDPLDELDDINNIYNKRPHRGLC